MKNTNMNLSTAISTIDEISKIKAKDLKRTDLNTLVTALSVINSEADFKAAHPIVHSALRFDGTTSKSRYCRTAVLRTFIEQTPEYEAYRRGNNTLPLYDVEGYLYDFLNFDIKSISRSIENHKLYEYNNMQVNMRWSIIGDISDIMERLDCIINKGKEYFKQYPDDLKEPIIHLVHIVHDIYKMYDRLSPEEVKEVIDKLNRVYDSGAGILDAFTFFRFLCKAAAFELSSGKPLSADAIHCTVNGEALYIFDFLRDIYDIIGGVMYIKGLFDQEKK